MASTFTNNLLLENATPLDPAQRNVWGTTENTGRTLVDSAIAGIQSLNLPAQAGYPTVILTSSQGQPDQARNAHFVLSGTLTANTLVLFPQSRNRMFTVNNTATGAFTVTVGVNNGSGAAAGTTAVVPQGQSINLFSDGTNVTTRVNGVVGGLTVSGGQTVDNLTVNGSTTYPNPTVGGTANAITLAYSVTPAGNVQGAKYAFKATAANTGATTVAINGGSPTNVFKKSGSGAVACTGGEINVGDVVEIEFDGTQYQIMSGTMVSSTLLMPTGAVLPYAGSTAPNGWLLANGQVVSQTTYAALYGVFGGAFNTGGEGAGNFRLPDMRGRVPAGYDPSNATGRLNGATAQTPSAAAIGNVGGEQAHTQTAAEVGIHSHTINDPQHRHSIDAANALGGSGTTFGEGSNDLGPIYSSYSTTGITINNSTGGSAMNVVQPTLVLNYIIKT